MSRERSKPETPFQGSVVKALRAAATARSMSFEDAVNAKACHFLISMIGYDQLGYDRDDEPATTLTMSSSVAGLTHL
jgi:hypothetical protein